MSKHECALENAPRFLDWIKNRGGVAVWNSIDFSNLGASWSTPALTDGVPTPKPTWQADSKPSRIITDPNEIEVIVRKEVKRFHVAIRRGSQGFSFKLTDASSRKVRAMCDKFGDESSYHFDYETQECVITMPETKVSLAECWGYLGDLEGCFAEGKSSAKCHATEAAEKRARFTVEMWKAAVVANETEEGYEAWVKEQDT
jgi:hypothetical protein